MKIPGSNEEGFIYTVVDSPIGELMIAGDERALRLVSIQAGSSAIAPRPTWLRDDARFEVALGQLREFLNGDRRAFDLTMAPVGTSFQLRVWEELCKIPYGETISYAELSRRIGRSTSVRAVGAANGANPLPILVPCHRVIGADGALIGYRGGLRFKKFLLALEASHSAPLFAHVAPLSARSGSRA